MKVVLDTNIYLSGLIFSDSKPAAILHLAEQGEFEVYCSNFIIEELKRILIKKFDYDERTTDQFVEEILRFVTIIIPKKRIDVIEAKKDDNRILESAIAARADYLVTGDKKHILPLGKIGKTKIISASGFLQEI